MNGINYKKLIDQKLHEWMASNSIKERCVVHHRDDTEECRLYNSKDAYYNMWGFNLDGSFEYGKYVVFMTRAEHTSHHHTGAKHSESAKKKMSEANKGKFVGNKNPMYGKHHSESAKKKMSEANKGKFVGDKNPMYGKHRIFSEETKQKMREASKQNIAIIKALYTNYKENGGQLSWNEFQKSVKETT